MMGIRTGKRHLCRVLPILIPILSQYGDFSSKSGRVLTLLAETCSFYISTCVRNPNELKVQKILKDIVLRFWIEDSISSSRG